MPKSNNFDLIRLGAAIQVAVVHSIVFFFPNTRGSLGLYLAELLPGVPIFFFVSGLLISTSFERNPDWRDFACNRALRIYPGLIVCFCVALALVWLSGYFGTVQISARQWLPWLLAQLSVGQFYNPDFMRDYGTGVLNGSMWTVTVELQFYVLVPVLYALLGRKSRAEQKSDAALIALIAGFALLNQVYLACNQRHSHELWYKTLGVSFVPWFYMFLTGVLCQRHWQRVQRLLAGKLFMMFIVYCLVAVLGNRLLGWNISNSLGVPIFLALAALVFTAAVTRPDLSDRVLRRNDVSYGIYIYHMPVANFLLATGFAASLAGFGLQIGATAALAAMSWFCLEKPALRLKRRPLYVHDRTATGGS